MYVCMYVCNSSIMIIISPSNSRKLKSSFKFSHLAKFMANNVCMYVCMYASIFVEVHKNSCVLF